MKQRKVILLENLVPARIEKSINDRTEELCKQGIEHCDIEIQIDRKVVDDNEVLICANIFYLEEYN